MKLVLLHFLIHIAFSADGYGKINLDQQNTMDECRNLSILATKITNKFQQNMKLAGNLKEPSDFILQQVLERARQQSKCAMEHSDDKEYGYSSAENLNGFGLQSKETQTKLLKDALLGWASEAKGLSPNTMAKFDGDDYIKTGHAINMFSQQSSQVACAFTTCTKGMTLSCLYLSGNYGKGVLGGKSLSDVVDGEALMKNAIEEVEASTDNSSATKPSSNNEVFSDPTTELRSAPVLLNRKRRYTDDGENNRIRRDPVKIKAPLVPNTKQNRRCINKY